MDRRTYGFAAAGMLFGAAGLELAIIASGHAWTRWSIEHNNIVSAVLAGFFALSGAIILLRDRSDGWRRAAFALGVASTLALFAHSLVGLAIVYLPLAFVETFLLYNTFRGSRFERRTRVPDRRAQPRTPMRWT